MFGKLYDILRCRTEGVLPGHRKHAVSVNVTVNKCHKRGNSQFKVSDYCAYLKPLNDGKTQEKARNSLSKISHKTSSTIIRRHSKERIGMEKRQ
jgi:hypothetical protein